MRIRSLCVIYLNAVLNYRDELDGHLDEVQLGLDNLRDILQNDDYKMDPSTLLGVSRVPMAFPSSLSLEQV